MRVFREDEVEDEFLEKLGGFYNALYQYSILFYGLKW